MSAFFCYTLPIGMGIYWIAGAVIRCIQQVIINKHIDKMDIDEIIEKNKDKAAKKMEKQKKNIEKMSAYANINTRNVDYTAKKSISEKASYTNDSVSTAETGSEEKSSEKNTSSKKGSAPAGSIAAKANLVREFNERK
jgi:YidC/Oxa1 family membrane protein insertase